MNSEVADMSGTDRATQRHETSGNVVTPRCTELHEMHALAAIAFVYV